MRFGPGLRFRGEDSRLNRKWTTKHAQRMLYGTRFGIGIFTPHKAESRVGDCSDTSADPQMKLMVSAFESLILVPFPRLPRPPHGLVFIVHADPPSTVASNSSYTTTHCDEMEACCVQAGAGLHCGSYGDDAYRDRCCDPRHHVGPATIHALAVTFGCAGSRANAS